MNSLILLMRECFNHGSMPLVAGDGDAWVAIDDFRFRFVRYDDVERVSIRIVHKDGTYLDVLEQIYSVMHGSLIVNSYLSGAWDAALQSAIGTIQAATDTVKIGKNVEWSAKYEKFNTVYK